MNSRATDFSVIPNIFGYFGKTHTRVPILLDTGAEASVISSDFLAQLSTGTGQPWMLDPPSLPLSGVAGDQLQIQGSIVLPLEIGGLQFHHRFEVMDGSRHSVILGWDFIVGHSVTINPSAGKILMHGVNVSLLDNQALVPQRCVALLTSDIELPAHTQMVIEGHLTDDSGKGRPVMSDFDGIFDPHDEALVAPTVVTASDGRIYLMVTNASDDPIELSAQTSLGHVFSINGSQKQDSLYELAEVSEAKEVLDNTFGYIQSLSAMHDDTSVPDDICTKLRIDKSLIGADRENAKEVLRSFQSIISRTKTDFGRTKIVPHTVPTGDARPECQRAYRTSPAMRQEIRKQVDSLLEAGVIEESYSPWAAPVVMVKKKNGTYRLCLDYRRLNAVTLKDAHPIPRVDDILDSLAGNKYFSTIDLASGYWQVEMDEADKEKTAFTTGDSLYQFKVMPMGLKNAPSTFSRLMQIVLHGILGSKVLVYLDDIIVFGATFQEKLDNLRTVFQRLKDAGLKIQPDKCDFFCQSVNFLGHIVSADGVRPDLTNVQKVRDWPVPKTVKDIKGFLGLCSYYRRFVPDFSNRAAPMNHLTQKGVDFQWTQECQQAFDFFKDTLTSEPIMAFPVFTEPFMLYTDASDLAVGSVLTQVHDSREHVIAYASSTLDDTQKRWSTYDRELYAIVWSIRHFKHYLRDVPFTIYTDHKPLVGLRKLPVDNERRTRWALDIDPLDWTIAHRAGKKHANADAMSRIPSVNAITNDSEPLDIHLNHLKDCLDIGEEQRKDPLISQALTWVLENKPPSLHAVKESFLRKLLRMFEHLTIKDGVLYRRLPNGHLRVVVPPSLQPHVLNRLHSTPIGGHLSATRAIKKAKQVCYWPYMERDLRIYSRSCAACQSRRSPVPQNKAPLKPVTSTRPFHRVAADLALMPLSSKGNQHLLVVTDYYTKYINLYALPDKRAETVAQHLFDNYISQHGVPEILHSDQGKEFEAQVVHQLCDLLGIRKTHTTSYHPQGDGQTERANRSLKEQLARDLISASAEPYLWDSLLGSVALCYNSTVHSTTQYSPYFSCSWKTSQTPCTCSISATKSTSLFRPIYLCGKVATATPNSCSNCYGLNC